MTALDGDPARADHLGIHEGHEGHQDLCALGVLRGSAYVSLPLQSATTSKVDEHAHAQAGGLEIVENLCLFPAG